MSNPGQPGHVVHPGEGEYLPAAGGRLLAGVAATGGRLTVIDSSIPAGDYTPPHFHDEMDEAFYVLEGEFTVTCAAQEFNVRAGAFVYLPHAVPHSLRAGADGGRLLILGVPAGLEDFFRDMADANGNTDMAALGSRHGITFL